MELLLEALEGNGMSLLLEMFQGARAMNRLARHAWNLPNYQKVLSSNNTTIYREPDVYNTQLEQICKQMENLTLTISKQNQKTAPRKSVSNNCNEEERIASQCSRHNSIHTKCTYFLKPEHTVDVFYTKQRDQS